MTHALGSARTSQNGITGTRSKAEIRPEPPQGAGSRCACVADVLQPVCESCTREYVAGMRRRRAAELRMPPLDIDGAA